MSSTPLKQSVPTKSARYAELDLIRAVATFCVVLLHSASPVLYQIAAIPRPVWEAHNVIDAACRICVPLFFMTSGFLLLSPPKDQAKGPLPEVGRRLLRIGAPLVVWSLFYALTNLYLAGQPIHFSDVLHALKQIPRGAAVYHLWFIYELAVFYAFLPFFRAFVSSAPSVAPYFVFFWISLSVIKQASALTSFPNWVGNYIWLGDSGYLVSGYLIRQYWLTPSARRTVAACFIYGLATATIIALTHHFSMRSGAFDEQFYVYGSPLVIAQSISAFVFLLHAGQKLYNSAAAFGTIVSVFSGASLGVYFMHVFILEHVQYNVLGWLPSTAISASAIILSTALYALALSWLIAWSIGWVRPLRWLVR